MQAKIGSRPFSVLQTISGVNHHHHLHLVFYTNQSHHIGKGGIYSHTHAECVIMYVSYEGLFTGLCGFAQLTCDQYEVNDLTRGS